MVRSLHDPVELPCGLTFPNRIVKAALAEQMAKATNHDPDEQFEIAYKNWGSGGWGAILTGNVQVDTRYSGAPFDVVIGSSINHDPLKASWRAYAAAIQSEGTPGIVQLCHPGRQSPLGAGNKGLFEKSIAPSPVLLDLGRNLVARAAAALLFGTPREMTVLDIKDVMGLFVDAARFLNEVGFRGVELHAAHGYLLAQFLSSKTNHRTDNYGGSPANRARIVVDIITEIRRVVPKTFAVGIKLNSVDHQQSGDVAESLEQIKLIADAGIDFIEISGGTYEDTKMMQDASSEINRERKLTARSSAREAFFLEFAKVVRQNFPYIILILTGGFRTRAGMQSAIDENACDLIGLGRPSVVDPHWPKSNLLNDELSDEQAQMWLESVKPGWLLRNIPIKVLGAGAESEYYASQIQRLGKGLTSRAPGFSEIPRQKL